MLNKFCFQLEAQNSLFIGENCNAFFWPPHHHHPILRVVPQCLAWCPARVGNSVKPSCIPFWESASGPQLLPTLGHHFSYNSISAESCLAGPVNVSKWCLKYVPRATLSSLRSLVSTLFQKKRKGSVFAIGLGISYQHLVFFPVYLLYPKMVLNWVAQYYANLQFWGLFTTE